MQSELVFLEEGDSLVALLDCEIDHHTARRLRERIDERLFLLKPSILVIDFSAVRFMDSSGIGLILGRSEKADVLGASVRIRGLSPTLTKLLRISGVDKVENIAIIG